MVDATFKIVCKTRSIKKYGVKFCYNVC